MHRKSLFFGIGIGSLVAVMIVFVAYIIQRASYINEISRLEELLYNEPYQVYAELHDEDIILMARELGMIFFHEIDLPQETNPNTMTEEITEAEDEVRHHIENPEEIDEIEEIEPPNPPVAPSPLPSPATAVPTGFRWVYIPEDLAASDIAAILGEAGIITNVGAFVQFLIDNGYTMTIMAGEFVLPVDGDFDVIVNQILAGM